MLDKNLPPHHDNLYGVVVTWLVLANQPHLHTTRIFMVQRFLYTVNMLKCCALSV